MPAIVSLDALAAALEPGERFFLPGSAGEPVGFVETIARDPERTRRFDVTTSAIPGINPLPIDRFDASARFSGMFMQPGFAKAERAGRFRYMPLPYSAFIRELQNGPGFDTCVVQVAPPDEAGRCSLGPAVELTPVALGKSRRILAIINARTPRIPGAEWIDYDSIDLAAETDEPLRTYDVGRPSAEAERIAGLIAGFVPDGATVEVGLGKVPDALLPMLTDRRSLRLFSGMLSDSALDLIERGDLDPAYRTTSCVWVASAGCYERLRGDDRLDVRSSDVTHNRGLAGVERLIAVNSALEVDLLGQCNLEIVDGVTVSGCGGAPDFARAASRMADGVSIVALQSTSARGTRSRIVPGLGTAVASLSRYDVDVVVTEHGAADLRGLSALERVERLIAVAAPEHRGALADAARDMVERI